MIGEPLEYSDSKKVGPTHQKRDTVSPLRMDLLRDDNYTQVVERSGVSNPVTHRDYQFAPDHFRSPARGLDQERGGFDRKSVMHVDDYVEKILSPSEANK